VDEESESTDQGEDEASEGARTKLPADLPAPSPVKAKEETPRPPPEAKLTSKRPKDGVPITTVVAADKRGSAEEEDGVKTTTKSEEELDLGGTTTLEMVDHTPPEGETKMTAADETEADSDEVGTGDWDVDDRVGVTKASRETGQQDEENDVAGKAVKAKERAEGAANRRGKAENRDDGEVENRKYGEVTAAPSFTIIVTKATETTRSMEETRSMSKYMEETRSTAEKTNAMEETENTEETRSRDETRFMEGMRSTEETKYTKMTKETESSSEKWSPRTSDGNESTTTKSESKDGESVEKTSEQKSPCHTCFTDGLACIRLKKSEEMDDDDNVACVEEKSLEGKDCELACPRAMKMTGKCKVR